MNAAHALIAENLTLQEQGRILRMHVLEQTIRRMDDTPTRAELITRLAALRSEGVGLAALPIDHPPLLPKFITDAIHDAEREQQRP